MDTLTNALLYPLTFGDVDCEREHLDVQLNCITAVKVVKEYQDDGVTCYDLELTVNDKVYKFSDLWAENRCSRMYYQSEVSQEIRDSVLKPYLLSKIFEGNGEL